MQAALFHSVPWRRVPQNHQYFIKFIHSEQNDAFSFLVTNLLRVWNYSVSKEAQLQKDKSSYCPHLTINSKNLILFLRKCLLGEDKSDDTTIAVSILPEQILTINIDSFMRISGGNISGYKLPFHWQFKALPLGTTIEQEANHDTILSNLQSEINKKELFGVMCPSSKRRRISNCGQNKVQSSDIDSNSSESCFKIYEQETEVLRDFVIIPLYSMVINLNNYVELLKKAYMQKGQELKKYRDMYAGVQKNNTPDINLDEMLTICNFDHEVDIAFSNQTGTLEKIITKVIQQPDSTNLLTMNSQEETNNGADLKDVTNEPDYNDINTNDCLSSITQEKLTPNAPISTEDSYGEHELIETEHEKEIRLKLEKRLTQQKEKQMKNKQKKKIMKAFL